MLEPLATNSTIDNPSSPSNTKMDQAILTDLPSEIIINILSRLPIKTIIECKCVCKSWHDLLKTPDFITVHLSRSAPGLIVYQSEPPSDSLNIFEFNDLENHESRYNPITACDLKSFISLPHPNISIVGSANGHLCLRVIAGELDSLYVCNPITRESIELPNPEWIVQFSSIVTYGFGISKRSGQYKVVRIFHECKRDRYNQKLLSIPKSECHVYTLGIGSWRRSYMGPGLEHEYDCHSPGAFLNGKLHWIVTDFEGSPLISLFDLEKESFSIFSLPPLLEDERFQGSLQVLGDCLCVCDCSSDYEFVVWVMKEYGVEKSWKKEVIISKFPDFASVLDESNYEVVYPLKVFKNVDFLMLFDDFYLFYYSDKTESSISISMFELQGPGRIEARIHISSFVSLESFTMEAVKSF